MDFVFYKNNDLPNKLNKTLIDGVTISGSMVEFSTIDRPKIDVRGLVNDYNYVFINEYNRYYFITDIIYSKNGVATVYLECDYLMSFKDSILNSKAQCKFSDNPNMYGSNRNVVIDVRPNIVEYPLPNNPFTDSLNIILLTQK